MKWKGPCAQVCSLGLLFVHLPLLLLSQKTDSLVFKNGNTMKGEIKSMINGVLTIETVYSKNDFTIEWSGVKEIYTKSRFLVTLKDGTRLNGVVTSVKDSNKVYIKEEGEYVVATVIDDMVYLKGLKSKFWSRMRANIDFGLNLSKANNLRELTLRSSIGYTADRWQLDLSSNLNRSSQDSIEAVRRTDGNLGYRYFLQHDWFIGTSINFLSNTEQALELRTTGKAGLGRLFIHTNKAYWGLASGLSFNHEDFSNETESRSSLELFLGSDLNLFDIKDFTLTSTSFVFPSLTESGRWRIDFQFDAKYDLPLDFYIKSGITFNFDNKPAVVGKEIDYVIMFTIGWEL
jgi:hypothetical protein